MHFQATTEKIPTEIYSSADEASVVVAKEIANLIRQKSKQGEMAVLGLATGSTPTGVYDELVRMHTQEGLSFKNVITFNLDEYYPIHPVSLQSYVRFMKEYLFNLIDIKPENINLPDGTIKEEEIAQFCKSYENKIASVGGIDIQILGIGRTGHIGFNEPGSGIKSLTRLITLDKITRTDAASDFFGEEHVPRRAITMGVGTILQAKRIIMMAWGEAKSAIVRRTVEAEITDSIPATYLQTHDNAVVILDPSSSADLAKVKTPWLIDKIKWNEKLTRRAVVWLSQLLNKSILNLTEEDYNEHGMSDLSALHGPAYDINIKIFKHLSDTITGWPGGKSLKSGDYSRLKKMGPFPKKILIFSPHPDDDVISMGGTLIRLTDQGHDVHVAYQTSGNIAVFDDEAIRFTQFVTEFNKAFNLQEPPAANLFSEMLSYLKDKQAGQIDSHAIKLIKGLIRRGEAKSACRYCNIPEENIHVMDLPFYETGKVKKKPLGEEDINLTIDLLQKLRPHQIYAAGDLSDPHGTHRVCLDAIFQAVERIKNEAWMQDCKIWLYRGAWQEWEIENIEMAVPISPSELLRKKRAIFKHQSQKDRPLFPGADQREFWQRAEDRNRTTAKIYDSLGLPEYEAIEAFVEWEFQK